MTTTMTREEASRGRAHAHARYQNARDWHNAHARTIALYAAHGWNPDTDPLLIARADEMEALADWQDAREMWATPELVEVREMGAAS